MTCPRCLGRQVVTYASDDGAMAKVCELCVGEDECPVCHGAGYVYRRQGVYTFATPCSCRAVHRRVELYNAAGIPARFHNAKLFNFEERVDHHHEIMDYLDDWVRGFEPGQEGILFVGRTGTGKTHLTCALLNQLLLDRGIPARFVDFFLLLSEIRQAYSTGLSEMAVLEPLMQVPVLAIDELGKGRPGDWERGVLDQLISHRYNNGLTTLFTTNHPLDQDHERDAVPDKLILGEPQAWEKVIGVPTLEERVGIRIYSRIREMCRPVILQGSRDIRLEQWAKPPVGEPAG